MNAVSAEVTLVIPPIFNSFNSLPLGPALLRSYLGKRNVPCTTENLNLLFGEWLCSSRDNVLRGYLRARVNEYKRLQKGDVSDPEESVIEAQKFA